MLQQNLNSSYKNQAVFSEQPSIYIYIYIYLEREREREKEKERLIENKIKNKINAKM